jgi:HEAT repeat protein
VASGTQQSSSLEQAYREASENKKKRNLAYKLAEVGTKAAVESLGRLFESEPEPELKEEILSALWLVDGSDKEKIVIYAKAVRPEHSMGVRLEAIDGLGDIDDPEAKTVLQSVANDPSEEIRDAVTDALASSQDPAAAP